MKEIKLSTGQITFVDDEDFNYLNQYKWRSMSIKTKSTIYNYVVTKNNNLMHRILLKIENNSKLHVDHINGNPLDNTKNNLRICCHGDNMKNRKIHSNNKSGYKGVAVRKDRVRWRSEIKLNNKTIHLGCFDTKIEAAIAYNKAAIKYHGKYAKLNEM